MVLARIWNFKLIHHNDGVFFIIEEVFVLKGGIVWVFGAFFV